MGVAGHPTLRLLPHGCVGSGGSRGVSGVSIETPFLPLQPVKARLF